MEFLDILTEKLHIFPNKDFIDSIYIKKDKEKFFLLEKYIELEKLNLFGDLKKQRLILNENEIINSKIIENFFNKYVNIENKTVLSNKITYRDNNGNEFYYTYMIYSEKKVLNISIYSLNQKELVSNIIIERQITKKEIIWNF